MGLIGSLVAKFKGATPPATQNAEPPELPAIRRADAEISIPTLRDDGIYAIIFAQAEMYDLGNIAFIKHYVLLDRKNKVAVDVTANVDQAELLSAVPRGAVLPPAGVQQLEHWLTGKEVPKYSLDFPTGVREFRAVEIKSANLEALRDGLKAIGDTRSAYDKAIDDFEKLFLTVRADVVSSTQKVIGEKGGGASGNLEQ